MIKINLLPHREEARKKRKEQFNLFMGASLLVGLLFAFLIYSMIQSNIENQRSRNDYIKSEISILNTKIKEIEGLEGEIFSLRERQKSVENLQSNRNMPVYLLNELVSQFPEGAYIKSIKQNGSNVEVQGTAQSNERVSEILRNFSKKSSWISNPDLKEIIAGQVELSAKDKRKVVNFNMKLSLASPGDIQKSATNTLNIQGVKK